MCMNQISMSIMDWGRGSGWGRTEKGQRGGGKRRERGRDKKGDEEDDKAEA